MRDHLVLQIKHFRKIFIFFTMFCPYLWKSMSYQETKFIFFTLKESSWYSENLNLIVNILIYFLMWNFIPVFFITLIICNPLLNCMYNAFYLKQICMVCSVVYIQVYALRNLSTKFCLKHHCSYLLILNS